MEIPISGDIRKIQSKDIGNFSFKQVAFIAVGLASAFVTFKMTGSLEVAIIPLMLILIFGFFKPCGMSCLTFIRTFLYEKAFTPQEYINESDFEVDEETLEMFTEDGVVVSEGMYVIQTAEPQNIKWTKADMERIAQ